MVLSTQDIRLARLLAYYTSRFDAYVQYYLEYRRLVKFQSTVCALPKERGTVDYSKQRSTEKSDFSCRRSHSVREDCFQADGRLPLCIGKPKVGRNPVGLLLRCRSERVTKCSVGLPLSIHLAERHRALDRFFVFFH